MWMAIARGTLAALGLGVGLTALAPAAAAEQEEQACIRQETNVLCFNVVYTNDPDYPCIERDGKVYCPIVPYYLPGVVIIV